MIIEALRGKRIAITGSTGFLGTALVERFLWAIPDCELVLIVRPGRRTASHRVKRDILRNDAFDRLRHRHGDNFDAEMDRRIFAVAGDVGTDGLGLDDEGRALLATCTTVIHSAAAVSFDSALDDAVEVNLLGPVRVAQAIRDSGSPAHLVAVSTCYVAGSRRGRAPEILIDESPFFVDADWRAEVDSARRGRLEAETASRLPEQLAKFRSEARRELGAAGTPALSTKIESLRQKWVNQRLVDTGRARASSLGFPDAYAFTKAMGERALGQTRGDVAVTIVRPSIIESSLSEPSPGWIRGFRMAEPVIAAYARGLLKEFPGVPEGTIDVIPCDLVVSTIIAAAARGPLDKPDVLQIASGSTNPLAYGELVDLVRTWFTEHPVYDDKGQPISVPEWSFPGRGRVARQLGRARSTLERADRVLTALPIRGRQADISADIDERREQLDRAAGYVELYGAYTESEAMFMLERTLELWDTLDADDQREFCFDPRVVDWPTYVHTVHLPSMVKQARLKMTAGTKGGESRTDRLRRQVVAPERQLAVFDLENTLIASNVVASYSWLASRHLRGPDRARFIINTLREAPQLLALDRADRSDFLRFFYRRFEDAPLDQLETDAVAMLSDLLLAKSFPAGIRRVREHRRAGHRTLLITGALDVVIEPLRPLFDDIVAAEMSTSNGSLDGQLNAVPPTGEARHQTLLDYADDHDLDLREAVAYADSSSDLPMLEAVGFPVAVNAETKLATIARRRGWLVEHWTRSPGAPRKLLPLARPVPLSSPARSPRSA